MLMRFSCPMCRSLLQISEAHAGQTITCPVCRGLLKVQPTQLPKREEIAIPVPATTATKPKVVVPPPLPARKPVPSGHVPLPSTPLPGLPDTRRGLPRGPSSLPIRSPQGPPRAIPRLLARLLRTGCLSLIVLFIILGGSTLWWFWIRVDGILGDLRDSQDRKVVLEAADKVVNLWPARLQHSTQQLAFEKLFQRLVNEDDAEMRTTVEQALERIGPPDDVAVLTTYLRDERSEVRAYCARTLAHDRLKNAPPAVLPAIRDALASDLNNGPANESIRRYLVRSLAKFADQDADLAVTLILKELPKKPLGGAPGHAVDQPPNEVQKEALNGLIRLADRAVHHPDGEVRYQTIVALRDLVTDHRSTRLLAFLAVLDNSDKRVSDAAESALAQLAPPLAPDTDSDVFPTILAHRNPDVRARGLRALGHPVPGARRDFALRSLLQALGDPDQNVQNQASRGLGEMSLDGKADVGVLKEFVVSRKNLEARKAAIEALARVEFTRDDTLIPSLLEGVLKDEPVAAVRLIALNAFCRDRRSKAKQPDLQSTRTQPALELASRDSDPAIRAAAQEALKLGGVISDLEKRLDSPN